MVRIIIYSTYIVELDEVYGYTMIFKVQRIIPLGFCPLKSFEVLDVGDWLL
jgi:hypothetical protein